MANTSAKTQKFNAKSPGFIYSIAVAVLSVLASMGVSFPKTVEALGMEIYTTFSTGGVYAIATILVVSVAFPIYNFAKSGGKWSFTAVFAKTSTWIALGNAALSLIALTGFALPEGTLEAVIGAIKTQDWATIFGILTSVIIPTVVRFLKDRNAA